LSSLTLLPPTPTASIAPYVGRLLRLTSLAPAIVEAILRGDEPNGISLEKLWRDAGAVG
jgi:hypothetical protein